MKHPLFWGRDQNAKNPMADNGTKSALTVEQIDNHIYFYTEVDCDRSLALIRKIQETDHNLRVESTSRWLADDHRPTPIWLHVQSPGGSLPAAFSVADQIQIIKTPIFSIVEGYCASGATLITLACERRYILPNAFMLIHQLTAMMRGKYEEFKDEMALLDMSMERLIEFYTTRTKMEEAEVRELLMRDSWFSAAQCVERGLVDEIFK